MTKTFLFLALAAILMTALAGCSQPTAAPSSSSSPSSSVAAPKEYQVTGEVLKLDPAAQTANLKAGKIEGWMEAMTMDFPVKDKQEFAKLKVGEKIQAKVLVQGTDFWLAGIAEAPSAAPK
ncbi:MAG TPA: copper-binding protein [Bryobacteraceae bacterium]|nr:copper-binding protein [Bryobacteraceae bacterium]